jgi:hypothetical protein
MMINEQSIYWRSPNTSKGVHKMITENNACKNGHASERGHYFLMRFTGIGYVIELFDFGNIDNTWIAMYTNKNAVIKLKMMSYIRSQS